MSIISRITTWTLNQILTSANLNGEFNNVVNVLNNLDAGTSTWDNINSAAYQLNGNPILSVNTYTPTVSAGFGTVSAASGFYMQVGVMVHTWGSFTCGTVAASTASLTVPLGSIVYTNRLDTNGNQVIGTFYQLTGSHSVFNDAFVVFADGSTTSTVFVSDVTPANGNPWGKRNGTSVGTTSAICTFDYWYSIA